MKYPCVAMAVLFVTASSASSGETIKLQAPSCGPVIAKEAVTVVDARELAGDSDAMVEALWKQVGPFSVVHYGDVSTRYWKFASKAVKRAKGIAADLGCDLLIITDKGRLATGNYVVNENGNVNQVEKGQVTAVYGCRWDGEIQPECPIPEEVLEESEKQQTKKSQ